MDTYNINVTITRYDEGDAFARFMLIGLGQMYLYGTVEITEGNSSISILMGEFRKNYCAGGLIGATATMESNVLPKVGDAIADAIIEQQSREVTNKIEQGSVNDINRYR